MAKPEECLEQALDAYNSKQFDKATAAACIGLLAFAIGAAHAAQADT